MRAWRSIFLGLAAICGRAVSQEGQSASVEDESPAPASVTWRRRADDRSRQLAVSEFTQACPKIKKKSMKACDRCLSNEMCPYDSATSRQWICSQSVKRCTDPKWNSTEIAIRCPVNLQNYSAWSAMCLYICTDQRSPFSCSGYCLNEDYPCKWVKGCHATSGDMRGMSADSAACLRPCKDHNSMLVVDLKYKNMADHLDTCAAAVKFYGCTNKWGANILELCPHTCRTRECQWRCGREELASESGDQCWKVVERTSNQYTCATAISEGYDCHCKCANAYLQMARAGGGAFNAKTFLGDAPVGWNKTVTVGTAFDISLSGQAMRTDVPRGNVKGPNGPRLKIVVKGRECAYGTLISGLSGITCSAPVAGSASATTASTCDTAPTLVSPYLHRWTTLKVNHCGAFDVCHCNLQCYLTKNWHHAGSLRVEPPTELGKVTKPLPGCARPGYTFMAPNPGAGEKRVKAITDITLKIFGSLPEKYRKYALHASKQALLPLLGVYSGLLKRKVPTASDIIVENARRRLLDSVEPLDTPNIGYALRRLTTCADNDAVFEAEAKKVNYFYKSCTKMLTKVPTMCKDPSTLAAITKGCQKTCGLCIPSNQTTTTGGPTAAPAIKGGSTMSFAFKITTHSDYSAAVVLGRLALLRTDPVPYIQRLFVELEYAKVPVDELPPQIWVTMTNGPNQRVIKEEDETNAATKTKLSANIMIFVGLGAALGGSCVIGLLFVFGWYCCIRRNKFAKVEPTADRELHQISEGGYRVQKVKIEGDKGSEGKPAPQPDCLERCCLRCWKRCCAKKLKKAQAFSHQEANASPADPSSITIGATVKLCGLSQAHYNGLIGTILSGPNEKGRFEVDLTVVDDHSLEEHQTLSFKPANMRNIDEVATEEPGVKSYRSGAKAVGAAEAWNS